MAPFIRVTVVKYDSSTLTLNGEKADYYVAINIKECIMENGKAFAMKSFIVYLLFFFFMCLCICYCSYEPYQFYFCFN